MKRHLMALLAASAMYIPVAAEAAPFEFHIAPQPLAQALEEFGRESSVQIVFTPAVVGDKLTKGVTGALEPVDALKVLLVGSGLTFKPSGAGYIIVPVAASAPDPVATRASADGALAVEAVSPGVAPAQAQPIGDTTVAEVVVTATKRSESALKVPTALTVLSGGDLKSAGVYSVEDLQNLVPGVSMSTSQDGVIIGIRGVQATDTSSKGEQDIAFNIDGVYVGRGNARTTAFFDIDRVEVLSGPQGTIYGRSSTGGAINLITNKPVLGSYSGYAKLEAGNFDAERGEGAVNIPLGDSLALRIAGAFNQRDGYAKPVDYDPTVNGATSHFSAADEKARNDESNQTARISLLYQPNSSVTGRLTTTLGHEGGVGDAPEINDFLTSKSGDAKWDILADPVPSFVNNHFVNVDGTLNVKLPANAQLDLLASEQYFHLNQQRTSTEDISETGGLDQFILMNSRYRTTEFEARVSNVSSATVDYVAGLNYFAEYIHEDGHLWNAPLATPTDPTTYQSYFGPDNNTDHKSWGAFAQGTWHLTPQWSVVLGARYTSDTVNRVGVLVLPFFVCAYPNDCNGVPDNGKNADSKVTWRVGVNYQVTPSNLLYADVATGFKGGGFNDYDPKTNGIGSYAPSSITAYELGYKGRPLDKLVLTSDLYYYDFAKDQISGVVSFPSAGETTPYTETTPVRMYGFENQLSYRLTPVTTFSGSLTLEHSEFVNFLAGQIYGDQVSWAGKPLDQTPDFVATLGVTHKFTLPGGASLKFRAFTKYSDGYYLSDIGDAVRYRQPSFTRTDMSLAYAPQGGRYSFEVFVQNLEDGAQRTSPVLGYNPVCPYGGVGGQCQVGGLPVYPKLGNGVIPAQPPYYLRFETNTPRFFGARLNVNF